MGRATRHLLGEGSVDGELTGGTAILFVIDGGARSALARFAGGDGNCQASELVNSGIDNGLESPDAAAIVLSGRTELSLAYQADEPFWGMSIPAGTSLGHAGGYDMNTVETDFGTMGGVELFSTPSRLTITDPDMTGSQPPSVGRSGMRLSWTNQANAVILGFTTVGENGDVLDSIYCGVTSGSDFFSLTLDDLPSLATAAYTVVEVGNVSNGTGSAGDGITNDVAAIHWQIGAVLP